MISRRLVASSLRGMSSQVAATTAVEQPSVDAERIVPKMNVSNLRPRHRIIAAGGIPPIQFEWERSRTANRQRFGEFGVASGADMRQLWPTVEEIEEEKALGFYREYQDTLREMKTLKEAREKKEKARIAELDKNEKKYADVLAKYKASQVKAEKERDAKEIALEKRIREIQEYFGYWMDPKDPRFEVMLQQKEAEEKKAEKLSKRAEAQKKKIAEVVGN